jgi:hypothetical protein
MIWCAHRYLDPHGPRASILGKVKPRGARGTFAYSLAAIPLPLICAKAPKFLLPSDSSVQRGVNVPRWCAKMLIILIGLSRLAAAQDGGNYTSLFDALPQLVDLQTPFMPNLAGGQNFTRCCLQAVYDSYQIVDGEVVLNPDTSFVQVSAAELNDTSFPCGASFNGSLAGSPVVNVPFSWCSTNCRGWESSSSTILTQWIQPFVGFILPAAVFCLNVSSSRPPFRQAVALASWRKTIAEQVIGPQEERNFDQ